MAQPGRIVLVLDRFTPARGGLERWAIRFAAWLLERGYPVHALTFEVDETVVPYGVVRHVLPRPAGRLGRAQALARRLDDLPPGLVHDFGVGWRHDLLHLQAGSRRSALRQARRAAPLAWRVRLLLAHARRAHEGVLERRQFAPGAGRIVAPSAMVKTQLVQDYGVVPSRIAVVPNGVDPAEFAPAGDVSLGTAPSTWPGAEAGPTFLFLAHNYHLKGLGVSLRALARLVRAGQPARLLVVGHGPAEAFGPLLDRLGVRRHVRFCGGVPDPRPYLAAADVLLHPTFYDACSLAVLEAWAMGLPAITSRWNGAHELWPGEPGPWLVQDPGRVAEVADAMRWALDPERRRAAGAVGRAVALAHSLERNFARIAALYAQIIPARRGS